jgi:hypothetical protein
MQVIIVTVKCNLFYGSFLSGVKRPGRDADYLPLYCRRLRGTGSIFRKGHQDLYCAIMPILYLYSLQSLRFIKPYLEILYSKSSTK